MSLWISFSYPFAELFVIFQFMQRKGSEQKIRQTNKNLCFLMQNATLEASYCKFFFFLNIIQEEEGQKTKQSCCWKKQ